MEEAPASWTQQIGVIFTTPNPVLSTYRNCWTTSWFSSSYSIAVTWSLQCMTSQAFWQTQSSNYNTSIATLYLYLLVNPIFISEPTILVRLFVCHVFWLWTNWLQPTGTIFRSGNAFEGSHNLSSGLRAVLKHRNRNQLLWWTRPPSSLNYARRSPADLRWSQYASTDAEIFALTRWKSQSAVKEKSRFVSPHCYRLWYWWTPLDATGLHWDLWHWWVFTPSMAYYERITMLTHKILARVYWWPRTDPCATTPHHRLDISSKHGPWIRGHHWGNRRGCGEFVPRTASCRASNYFRRDMHRLQTGIQPLLREHRLHRSEWFVLALHPQADRGQYWYGSS